MSDGKRIEVRQIRSPIGYEKSQARTLKALGLGRIGRSRELPDTPQVRGMVAKVVHLVEVRDGAEA